MSQLSLPKLMPLAAAVAELKTARWIWCLLLVVVVAFRHLSGEGAVPLGPKFGDTDDAMRLLQIREFLINGYWYDTRLAAIGAPDALNSHWSRLIDLPVAWLISFFALFTTYLSAEALAQIVWPLLLLFVLARFLVYEAERRAGTNAGVIVLAMLVLAPSALFQFQPGRIDHHNAQILCAVAGIFLLQRAITNPAAGWWAGGTMAVGLIVGFEALPLLAVSLGLACLVACFDTHARTGAARAVIALTGGLVVGYALTTHPAEWLTVNCDELSPNLLALCGAGALAGAILHGHYREASPWVWIAGFSVAGVAGIGAYFAAAPVCASGAFVGMDDIVKTQWLATVVEGKTLLQFAAIHPSLAFSFLAVMAMSLTVLIRQAVTTRTSDHVFMALSTLLAGLYGFYYIKFMPYGMLLALAPLACWIARLPAIGETSAFSVRLGTVMLTSQLFFAMVAGVAVGLFSNVEASAKKELSSGVSSCMIKSDIAALSKLPPGLVISDIDLGPFIALSTGHRAYAAPHHRIHASIRDLLVLQDAPLGDAGRHLARMNGDYLVLCGVTPNTGKQPAPKAEKFSTHMRRGGSFEGLEPISIGATKGPLKVWKITKSN